MGSKIASTPDGKGRTPMHAAAYSDHLESLHMLLSHGGSVNQTDDAGRTTLMYAAMSGHCGAIDVLLENGAGLGALDSENNTALHFACVNVSIHQI